MHFGNYLPSLRLIFIQDKKKLRRAGLVVYNSKMLRHLSVFYVIPHLFFILSLLYFFLFFFSLFFPQRPSPPPMTIVFCIIYWYPVFKIETSRQIDKNMLILSIII